MAAQDDPSAGGGEGAGRGATALPSPCVGRGRELERLGAALEEAVQGHGRLVFLTGEPGAGKTRVAEEIAHRARRRGAHTLWGRCWEQEGAPDLWPWLQVIRTCLRAVDEPTLRQIVGPHANELTALVAPLRDRRPDVELPAASPAARFRLFNAIAHFLEAYSERAPLVVVLEDLHRADAASLLLLQFFTQELRQRPILVLATYREPGAPPNRALTQAVIEALREPGSERLILGPLGAADVGAMLAGLLGVDPPPELVEGLRRRTGGNAFFLTECARHLGRAAGLPAQAAEMPIPAEVRERIEQRLAPLTDEERRVLRLAAELGAEFGVDELYRRAGAAGHDAAAALAAMEASGLIVRGPASGTHHFAHGMVREHLAGDLPPAAAPEASSIAAAAPPRPPARATARSLFRREGEYWTVGFAGRTCRLRDVKGMAYVALLLRHPRKPLHVSELVNLAGGVVEVETAGVADDAAMPRIGLGDAGVVLDAQAKAEYRRRLEELRAELEQARAFHDGGRAERAQHEIDFLTQELASAVGLGGRDRRVGSAAERARVNVTRSIGRALERIGEVHPELAAYLGETIRTGTFCTYQPDSSIADTWEF